jgi:hypothetical protein
MTTEIKPKPPLTAKELNTFSQNVQTEIALRMCSCCTLQKAIENNTFKNETSDEQKKAFEAFNRIKTNQEVLSAQIETVEGRANSLANRVEVFSKMKQNLQTLAAKIEGVNTLVLQPVVVNQSAVLSTTKEAVQEEKLTRKMARIINRIVNEPVIPAAPVLLLTGSQQQEQPIVNESVQRASSPLLINIVPLRFLPPGLQGVAVRVMLHIPQHLQRAPQESQIIPGQVTGG